MADSYHIIDGKVVPYSGGRKCNDTDAWRDATPLELQLQEQLAEYEHATAAKDAEIDTLRTRLEDTVRDSTNKIEALRAEVNRFRALEAEAAEFVELPIINRTAFTGEAPYVGWRGLGRALNEALDERDALRAEVERSERYAEQSERERLWAEHRAERLEEALRLAEEHLNDITPEWYSAGQRVLAKIRAALKQEEEK